MGQFGLAEIEKMRAMLQAEDNLMFYRHLPVFTQSQVERLGSFCDTQTVRVDSDGTVTIDDVVVGHAGTGFTIPLQNVYAGSPVRVTYKSNPSEWIAPVHSNRNKRILSKAHKRARKKIAAASRKRNRK